MSGSTMGYDDGGAIPDDSYTPSQDDAASQDQQTPQEVQPSAQLQDFSYPQAERGTWTGLTQETPGQFAGDLAQGAKEQIGQGIENIKNSTPVRLIMNYLNGGDAAAPAVAQKFQAGVQAQHPGVSPDDANMIAVHKAMELGGPEAAWAMVQFNRRSYNAKTAFARTALTGVPGKPADMNSVADAATQAAQNVLDGSQTRFIADPSGNFTATVKLPGSDAAQSYMLTKPQMAQYLDVGKDGQWDRVMETGGVPATLARITRGSGSTARPVSTAAPGSSGGATNAGNANDRRAQIQKAIGNWPVTDDDLNSGYDPETIARGYARFGHGVAQNPERNQWMAEQEQAENKLQNNVDVAKQKAESWEAAANARANASMFGATQRAGATKYQADQRLKGAEAGANARTANATAQAADRAANRERLTSQSDRNERGRNARAEINALNLSGNATDDKMNAIWKKWGFGPGGQGAAPQSAAPQTPQAAAPRPHAPPQQNGTSGAVPPANKRVTGQVYSTPKGQFRWMGNGWQPAQ